MSTQNRTGRISSVRWAWYLGGKRWKISTFQFTVNDVTNIIQFPWLLRSKLPFAHYDVLNGYALLLMRVAESGPF